MSTKNRKNTKKRRTREKVKDFTREQLNDITASYRGAKDKADQIGILAELNACDKEDIIQVLREAGFEPVEKPATKRGRKKAAEKPDAESKDEPKKGTRAKSAQKTQKAAVREEPEKVPDEIPASVRSLICGRLVLLQERIDCVRESIANEMAEVDRHENEMRELNAFLGRKR